MTWDTDRADYRISVAHSTPGDDLLAQFKTYARIDTNAEDERLVDFLNMAAARLEDDLATLLVIGEVIEYYDIWPWDYWAAVHLHRAPVDSITHIKYYDADGVLQTWNSTNYDSDLVAMPARIIVSDAATLSSPALDDRQNAVVITYQAGIAATAEALNATVRNLLFLWAGWKAGPGRDLLPEIDAAAVERCWQNAISRLRWTI